MSEDLTLNLKGVYFDQIAAGTKPEEYRLANDYWRNRLVGRTFRNVIVKRGYPKNGDASRVLVLPWRGYTLKAITHPHFGPKPVEVFAINVDRGAA